MRTNPTPKLDEMMKNRCPYCGGAIQMEEPIESDSTPTLTAEEKKKWAQIYADELITPAQIEHDTEVRRQAFEEAASKIQRFICHNAAEVKDGYLLSLDTAQTRELWNLLAKEQADG